MAGRHIGCKSVHLPATMPKVYGDGVGAPFVAFRVALANTAHLESGDRLVGDCESLSLSLGAKLAVRILTYHVDTGPDVGEDVFAELGHEGNPLFSEGVADNRGDILASFQALFANTAEATWRV